MLVSILNRMCSPSDQMFPTLLGYTDFGQHGMYVLGTMPGLLLPHSFPQLFGHVTPQQNLQNSSPLSSYVCEATGMTSAGTCIGSSTHTFPLFYLLSAYFVQCFSYARNSIYLWRPSLHSSQQPYPSNSSGAFDASWFGLGTTNLTFSKLSLVNCLYSSPTVMLGGVRRNNRPVDSHNSDIVACFGISSRFVQIW